MANVNDYFLINSLKSLTVVFLHGPYKKRWNLFLLIFEKSLKWVKMRRKETVLWWDIHGNENKCTHIS